MQLVTTVSQKGQIVIPKRIRDKLNLKASDTLTVGLKGRAIVVRPLPKQEEIFGMFKAKKPITKKDIKGVYKAKISNKYR